MRDQTTQTIHPPALRLVDTVFDQQCMECRQLLDRARALTAGDPVRAADAARRALRLARDLGGPPDAARQVAEMETEANLLLARALRGSADPPGADAALDAAEQLLNTRLTGASELRPRLHLLRGLVACDQGELARARDHFSKAGQIFRQTRDHRRLAEALVLQALAECRGGEPEAGLWHLERGLEPSRMKGRPALVLAAAFCLVDCLRELGYLVAAFDLARRLEERAGALRLPGLAQRARWKRATVELRLDRRRDAEEGLRAAWDGFLRLGRFPEAALVCLDLAEHYLEDQRHPDLRQLAVGMFPLFVARGLSPGVRDALVQLRESLSGGRADRAELARLRTVLERSRRDRTHR